MLGLSHMIMSQQLSLIWVTQRPFSTTTISRCQQIRGTNNTPWAMSDWQWTLWYENEFYRNIDI